MARRPYSVNPSSRFRGPVVGAGGALGGMSVQHLNTFHGIKTVTNNFTHPVDVSLANPATLVQTDIGVNANESATLVSNTSNSFTGQQTCNFIAATANNLGSQWVQGGAITGWPGATLNSATFSPAIQAIWSIDFAIGSAVTGGTILVGMFIPGTAVLTTAGAFAGGGSVNYWGFRIVNGDIRAAIQDSIGSGYDVSTGITAVQHQRMRLSTRLRIRTTDGAGIITDGSITHFVNGKDVFHGALNSAVACTAPINGSPGYAAVQVTAATNSRVAGWGFSYGLVG